MKYLNKVNLIKLRNISSRYPRNELIYKILEKLQAPYRDYPAEYQKYLPGAGELAEQKQTKLPYSPRVSIVVPAYETDELFLRQMIGSVLEQTYGNWELCIADGSQSQRVERVIHRDYAGEPRIKYQRLAQNGGISENTNQGFQMASGEYIALLDHDDLLVPSALYEMVKRINETGADFLYSDEDKVTADLTEYMDPHFKLDFNRELLLGNNYICHFLMVSKELLKQVGGLDGRYDGAQDFEFVLRCSRYAEKMEHVAKVLYHWRVHPASTAGNTNSKLYAYEAGKRAVEDFIAGEKWNGTVTITNDLGFYKTRYAVPKDIVIGIFLWGEASGHFKKIQEQIQQELTEIQAEVIWDYDLSRQADYIFVLNRAAVSVKAESLRVLLGSCSRADVGIVGGRTVVRGKVQQCGYWKEEENYVPRFEGLPGRFRGYYRRAYLPVEVDAVGNDLAVVKAEIMKQINAGGREPEKLDQWQSICEKVRTAGYRVIAEPEAQLERKP